MNGFGKSFLYLFGFSLCLFHLTMSGHLFSQDGEILYRSTESFSEFNGGAIPPLGGQFYDGKKDSSWGTRRGKDNREYPQYGVGQPILATPFYSLGRIVAPTFSKYPPKLFGRVYPPFQYHNGSTEEFVKRFCVLHFNLVVSALTTALFGLFCHRVFASHTLGIVMGIVYATGTITWVQSRTFFTEPLATFCVLAAFYLMFRAMTRWDRGDVQSRSGAVTLAGLSGLCFGYGFLTRPDTLLFLPGLGTLISWPSWAPSTSPTQDGRGGVTRLVSKWPIVLSFGGVSAVFGAIPLWLNFARFGSVFATGYSDQLEGVNFDFPLKGLGGLLFSPGKSLFLFSPPLILGVAAIRTFYVNERRLAAGLLLGSVSFLLFEASWQNWEGGWCWGPRHIIQLTPLLLLPAGAVIMPRMSERPRWVMPTLILCLLLAVPMQLLGISADFIEVIHKYAVEHRTNPYALQATIYSIGDSSPMLHLKFLLHNEHDVFWLHYIADVKGAYRLLPLLPLSGLSVFALLIRRALKREKAKTG